MLQIFLIVETLLIILCIGFVIFFSKDNGFNNLILDTSGSLQVDTDMMAELLLIDRIFNLKE